MNIGKATRIALIRKDKKAKWLADEMNVSVAMVRKILYCTHANTKQAEKLANVFDMKTSDFIALGE
jgi:hypothetical protein